MPLFLTISFLMNIIALAAILYLYKQIQMLKDQNPNNFSEITGDFLKEIRKENNELQARLLSNPSQKPMRSNHLIDPQNTIEKQLIDKIDSSTSSDQIETSLQANILQLYNQGISIENIAKQLNCGTTEAALTIKFYEDKLS